MLHHHWYSKVLSPQSSTAALPGHLGVVGCHPRCGRTAGEGSGESQGAFWTVTCCAGAGGWTVNNQATGLYWPAGWCFQTFFIFHHIWDNHPNWLSYFSEGLKPPTSQIFHDISNIHIPRNAMKCSTISWYILIMVGYITTINPWLTLYHYIIWYPCIYISRSIKSISPHIPWRIRLVLVY